MRGNDIYGSNYKLTLARNAEPHTCKTSDKSDKVTTTKGMAWPREGEEKAFYFFKEIEKLL